MVLYVQMRNNLCRRVELAPESYEWRGSGSGCRDSCVRSACGCALTLHAACCGALTLKVAIHVPALMAHMTSQLNCPAKTALLVLNANRLVLNVGPTVRVKQPAIWLTLLSVARLLLSTTMDRRTITGGNEGVGDGEGRSGSRTENGRRFMDEADDSRNRFCTHIAEALFRNPRCKMRPFR